MSRRNLISLIGIVVVAIGSLALDDRPRQRAEARPRPPGRRLRHAAARRATSAATRSARPSQIIRQRVDAPRRGRARDHPPGRRHRREPARRQGPGPALQLVGQTAELRFRPVLEILPPDGARAPSHVPPPRWPVATTTAPSRRRPRSPAPTDAHRPQPPTAPPVAPTDTDGRAHRHDGAHDGHHRARHHDARERPGRPAGRAARARRATATSLRRYRLGPAFLTGSAVERRRRRLPERLGTSAST